MAKKAEEPKKKMTVREFYDLGLLQEVNRRFFHPMGLALEVVVDAQNRYKFGELWDRRDDTVGLLYDKGVINQDRIARVDKMIAAKSDARTKVLGDTNIQSE